MGKLGYLPSGPGEWESAKEVVGVGLNKLLGKKKKGNRGFLAMISTASQVSTCEIVYCVVMMVDVLELGPAGTVIFLHSLCP